MGLTVSSGGRRATSFTGILPSDESRALIAMAGNPNVGKSSLFNCLTGMHQHTGNWTGKTIGCTVGVCRRRGKRQSGDPSILLADLPGCYSLNPRSSEERAALDFLLDQPIRAVVVVCDAMNLQRNLLLAYQIHALPRAFPIILCVNLMDEAEKKGVRIDKEALEKATGFSVVLTSARDRVGMDELYRLMVSYAQKEPLPPDLDRERLSAMTVPPASDFYPQAKEAARAAVKEKKEKVTGKWGKWADNIICGKYTAIPVALLLLTVVFWLTIKGANVPSALLSDLFSALGDWLQRIPIWTAFPWWVKGILMDGIYGTVTWVVAVMLPPMAIFFPLFTILEDVGFLPRIAFNFDRCFQSCHACGKQALTMCMGFGCNAAGVAGCRIIDSPRERLVAILTNSFMPCNGKFPTLLAMLAVGFAGVGSAVSVYVAMVLTLLVVLAVAVTWLASRLLSATCLRGESSAFILELPPYRKPAIGQVLIRSFLDRTLFVLGRAVAVAAPAGGVIWLMTHLEVGSESLLSYGVSALEPLGRVLGLDGAVLIALLLSIPANELTVPILLMIYMHGGQLATFESYEQLWRILQENGWGMATVVCFIILFMFHAPCSTTLLTVRKETGKWRWAFLAAALPLAVGLLGCLCANLIACILA